MSSLVLRLILQIILNKRFLRALFRVGVRSRSLLKLESKCFSDLIVIRCTAQQNNLDGGGGRRSRDHTELLVRELELGVLWDEYGLVGDIVVCRFKMYSIP